MTTLTETEIDAVRRDQLARSAELYERPLVLEENWRNARRVRTRYHVILRPEGDNGERLRVLVAASRHIGEIALAVDWFADTTEEHVAAALDCYAGWWSFRWDMGDGEKGYILDRAVPVWPWASLAGDGLCNDSPWEWIAKAARGVEPKGLPAYFAAAAKTPRVESIAKAGLSPRWFGASILQAMGRDPALVRYVSDNLPAIRDANIPPSAVLYGYRRGWPIRRAEKRFASTVAWHGCPRYGIDLLEADKYFKVQHAAHPKTPIARSDLSDYWGRAQRLGLDLRSRSVAFPRQFLRAAADARIELDRRASAERKRAEEERRRNLAMRDERLGRLARMLQPVVDSLLHPAGWSVRIPVSQDEFAREGAAMHNCIGNGKYSLDMSLGLAVCMFLSGPAGIRVDCEIALPKGRGRARVAQCYVAHNLPPPLAALDFARRIAKALDVFKCKLDKGA